MKEKRVFKNKWFEFYPHFSAFRLMYSIASYFDERHMLSISSCHATLRR